MAMVRYSPVNEFVTLRDAMDRLFQDSVIAPWSSGPAAPAGMPIDLFENDDELVVKAVVPGIKPEDIDIQVLGDTVTIKAAMQEVKPESGTNVLHRERATAGQMCRAFRLPVEVDPNRADAQFEHGILTLTLPKAEAAKPKQIKVKVEAR